ncbi:MAG: DUF3850 domain-containing protein [Robiginitomaculum sp.]|nr:DUF3850 domain-containing protein [Robiginitomaculum sp.]
MNHKLKIKPAYLAAKAMGEKLFEVRRNDRDFKVGDTVAYSQPFSNMYDKQYVYEITYVSDFMQAPGYIVFGERQVGNMVLALRRGRK